MGAFFAGMATGTYIDRSDRGEAALACVSAEDARTLWQKAYALNEDPMDVNQNNVNAALTYFPDYASRLPSDCETFKTSKYMYYCK